MPCQRCVAVAVGLGAGRTSCMPTRAMTLRVAALICASLALRDVLPGAASSAMTGSGVIAGWLSAHTPGWQPSASCVLASNAGSIFTSRCFLWLAASSAFAISHRFVSRSYCPYNDAECRCGEFCITSVWSTPKNPGNHARALRRVVDNCTTHRKQQEAADDAEE